MQAPGPLYEYIPLMGDGSTFRIVTIAPGTDEDRMECFFLEVPTEAKPQYSALSYTWGSPEINSFVWVHGRVIGIAENLTHALRRLRHLNEVRNFWIDALCINQHDDAGEKTIQIPLMRRIYHQSCLVTIYLGAEEDDSASVPALCNRIGRAYGLSEMSKAKAPYFELPLNSDNFHSLGLPESNSREWLAITRLLGRPWFMRLWVIQEAVLSNNAQVICGSWTYDWMHLLFALMLAAMLGAPVIASSQEGRNSSASMTQLSFLFALGAGRPWFTPWKCISLLHRGRAAFATVSHDHIYGLLGLSEEYDDPDLKPNYALPVETVYRQFARHFVTNGDGVQVLYNASGHRLRLPSWVPDWSYRYTPQARIAPQPLAQPIKYQPCAAAATQFSSAIRLCRDQPDLLQVQGLLFDYMEELGEYSAHADAEHRKTGLALARHETGREDQSSLSDSGLYSSLNESFLEVGRYLTELVQILRRGEISAYPTGETEESVVWKTLICNFTKSSSAKAPAEYARYFKAFVMFIRKFDPSWQVPHQQDEDWESLFELAKAGSSSVFTQAKVFLEQAHAYCRPRRRGRTKRGYVGQFLPDTQVGDWIFLPLGSAVPFVIRRLRTEVYELIGECYVHGIMNGESFGIESVKADIYIA